MFEPHEINDRKVRAGPPEFHLEPLLALPEKQQISLSLGMYLELFLEACSMLTRFDAACRRISISRRGSMLA